MNHIIRTLSVVLLVSISLQARAGFYTQVTPIYEFLDTPIAQDMFGSTGVQISNDGLTFLAASPNIVLPPSFNDATGSGYPFQYVNGAWTSLGGYVSGPPELFGYGTGLALSANGNMAFLGFAPNDPMNPMPVSPVANVFQLPFGLFETFNDPTLDQFSGFGSTGALSSNGYTAIIGAPEATTNIGPQVGEANIYTYDGSSWSPPTTISDPNTGTPDHDEFSSAVAISADGSTALIGSNENGGTAYMYNPISGAPFKVFGNVVICQGCMALSADGQTAVIATDAGVTVYSATDSPAWSGTPIAITDPSGYVAISGDGKAILIGTYDNIVYLYTLSSGVWTLSSHEFDGGMTSDYDGYGWTGIALSSDKETVAISAGFATINSLSFAGAVYVYQSSADLSLSMTATPSLAFLNQQVSLGLTVTNNDTEVTAYNVVLTETLPAGLTYVGSIAAGGSCSLNGAIVTCIRGSLAPGTTWQPTITVKVSTAGAYNDSATVTSNQPDPDTSNNTANASISMLPPTVSDGSVTTNQDTPVNGTLTGSNPCNCGTPVFSVVTQPGHGNVSITNTATGAFTYTPNMGYSGSDSFTFKLANGLNTSGTAAESVTVNPSGGGGGGGSGVDFLALGLLGGLLAIIRRRLKR